MPSKKQPKIKRNKHGPEWYIQRDLIRYLEDRGWLVERLIGNALQVGIPDIWIYHFDYGPRWIDVKNLTSYEFTPAQRDKWPKWEKHGVGIWILTAATQSEYDKLFGDPNWRDYWKPKYNLPSIDEAIDALREEV